MRMRTKTVMDQMNAEKADDVLADLEAKHGSLATTGSPFFIFDVESMGLHGEGFAVAGGVYLANGAAQWEFRYACPTGSAWCDDAEDRTWVDANVPVLETTHRTPELMRHAFWQHWLKAKKAGAQMAVECGWPVEAEFLHRCIHDQYPGRKWDGPYPLHEIATYMAAAGMDPMAQYKRRPSELPMHDPLADARLSARLLSEALAKMGND